MIIKRNVFELTTKSITHAQTRKTVSSNKNLKVIHVVKKMQKRWGNAKWKIKKVSSFSENKLLYLNSNKAKKLLKWQSKLDLNATINYTAD